MASVELEVTNAHGLHARPAALFVAAAAKFQSKIAVRNLAPNGKTVDAKSILALLTAGINAGSRIEISAEGEDADAAVAELSRLVREGLGE